MEETILTVDADIPEGQVAPAQGQQVAAFTTANDPAHSVSGIGDARARPADSSSRPDGIPVAQESVKMEDNPDKNIDCIVIGYNDYNFASVLEEAKRFETQTGSYWQMKSHSAAFNGQRIPFNALLNEYLSQEYGEDTDLHVCRIPNLAVCHLSYFLQQRGLEVAFVNFFTEEKERLAALLKRNPKSVAITTTFYVDSVPITDIISFIRQHNEETRIIVGGPHIYNLCSQYNDRILNVALGRIGADCYINDSQGELTLSRVVNALRQSSSPDLSSIPNLVFADGDSFSRTLREPEQNLMDEISIDWSSFDPSFVGAGTPVPMRTARSCAFSCAFCNYPVFAGPLNLTSLDVVERELQSLHDTGVKRILFIDDTFNVPLPRFKNLCRMMIERKFDFEWFSYFRCSNSDDEAFDLMQASGCRGVFLGIESGDQSVLDNMNKKVKIEQYRNGIRKLKERGIITFASFIIGFPGESQETALNTRNFIQECAPTFYRMELYYHSRLAPIHQRAEEFELRGSSFGWRHRTMDWREACAFIRESYMTITNSVILPGHAFDFWSLPYLLEYGLSADQIKQFLLYGRDLLLDGLDAPAAAGEIPMAT